MGWEGEEGFKGLEGFRGVCMVGGVLRGLEGFGGVWGCLCGWEVKGYGVV